MESLVLAVIILWMVALFASVLWGGWASFFLFLGISAIYMFPGTLPTVLSLFLAIGSLIADVGENPKRGAFCFLGWFALSSLLSAMTVGLIFMFI